jgi:WD40 repeat protein
MTEDFTEQKIENEPKENFQNLTTKKSSLKIKQQKTELETQIDVLMDQKNGEGIWQLIFNLKPQDAANVVAILKNSGWTPSEKDLEEWNKLLIAYPDNGFFLEPVLSEQKHVDTNIMMIEKSNFSDQKNIVVLQLINEAKNNDLLTQRVSNDSLYGNDPRHHYLDAYQLINDDYNLQPLYSKDEVYAYTISEDGELLAITAKQGNISLFNALDGKLIRIFDGPAISATDIFISKDNKTLFVGYDNGKIISWDIASGNQLRIIDGPFKEGSDNAVRCIEQTHDGSILATAIGPYIFLWNMIDGSLIKQLKKHTLAIFSMKISYDDKYIIAGYGTGMIVVWQLSNKKMVFNLRGHNNWISSIEITRDNQVLVSGDKYYGNIFVWNLQDGTIVKKISVPGTKTYLKISEDGTKLKAFNADSTGTITEYAFSWNKRIQQATRSDLEYVQKSIKNIDGLTKNVQSWKLLEALISAKLRKQG